MNHCNAGIDFCYLDMIGDVFEVFLVQLWQYNFGESGSVSSNNFFFDSADRQDHSSKSNLSGHSQIYVKYA